MFHRLGTAQTALDIKLVQHLISGAVSAALRKNFKADIIIEFIYFGLFSQSLGKPFKFYF